MISQAISWHSPKVTMTQETVTRIATMPGERLGFLQHSETGGIIDSRISSLEKYYHAIDNKDLATVYSLFSPQIVYQRGTGEPMKGIRQFRRFYEAPEGRIIASGNHTNL